MSQHVIVRGLALAGLLAAQFAQAQAASPAPQLDPAAYIARIEKDIEALRGLAFLRSVPVAAQTPEDLGRYLDAEMAEVVPPALAENFGRLVKRLGLHRGPELGNLHDTMRTVMTSQVAAYYDPEAERIFILQGGGSEQEEGLVYSHELYHALQDQHFDLQAYMPEGDALDADQALARTAVVEGEATYLHTMWLVRSMSGMVPPRAVLGTMVQLQADLAVAQLQEMAGGAVDMDDVPPFLIETLLGNYMKGAVFVHAVHEKGWAEVEKLYREYPPASTEQILHPEKWFAREAVSSIRWTDLSKERLLRDWELIDEDALGEIQWRIIFKVQEQADGDAAAAGWDGDRYAVFRRKGGDETLMLLRTAWDSEADATEFAAAYRRLLGVKYAGANEPVRVEQQGTDVFIVEGGRPADLDALMQLARKSTRQRR